MKKFEAPMMDVQRFGEEDIVASSDCRTEALGCESCYVSAGQCGDTYVPCASCAETDW
ncbi:MAG: hypothetical protein IKP72_13765 [Clostridia bacterium]|nr:hypothetical protein [Clostridia bacterium]